MATGEERNKWDGILENDQTPLSADLTDLALTYAGKKSVEQILALPAGQSTRLWQGRDQPANQLYYGDNLPLLATLAQNPAIRGQVRLIYIDPPFATNKVFKSRTRQDAYHDLLGGATYLEFMRERLIWLRELLADDGSIYLHLDDNMIFHLKIIMDEIFGRANFRNLITRRKCNPKNYTRNQYGNISDYILFYTKSANYIWNRPYQAWTSQQTDQEYPYTEESSGRRYKKVPLHAPGERNGATGQPWRGMLPPPGKHWQYPPETLEAMDARGEIYWSPNGNPRRKIYLDDSQGIPIQDIWLDLKDAHNQNIKITGYPTEKPLELLKRVIAASSRPGDLVLDCFSGSGTTLHAAADLNRAWIGMDASLEAIKTTLRRFMQGLEPMGDFVTSGNKPATQQKMLPIFEQALAITDFELWAASALSDELLPIIQSWEKTLAGW